MNGEKRDFSDAEQLDKPLEHWNNGCARSRKLRWGIRQDDSQDI